MLMLSVLLQAASPSAGPPARFSILAADDCVRATTADQVVVCGRGTPPPRLPLPGERPPADIPRQPTGDPTAGLEHANDGACALHGCQVGVMLPILPIAAAGIRAIRHALAPRPDRGNRVAIDLESPPPSLEGRLQP